MAIKLATSSIVQPGNPAPKTAAASHGSPMGYFSQNARSVVAAKVNAISVFSLAPASAGCIFVNL